MDEKSNNEEGLTLDKKTMDVLVANIIPTSRHFEVRFDHMQSQIDDINHFLDRDIIGCPLSLSF